MSISQRRALQASMTALAVVGIGFGAPMLHASAEPSPTAKCLDAGNVWVLVEFDDGVKGACATEFATGFEALDSAGFSVDASADGFLNTIDGEPSTRGPEDWWSYASSNDDLTGWEFYQVGGKTSEPEAGSIEGWRLLHSYDTTDNLPSTTPADLLGDVEPTTTPSSSMSAEPSVVPDPSPEPSATMSSAKPAPAPPKTGN